MAQVKNPIAAALGAAFLATALSPLASADVNPFSAQQLSGGYDLASFGKAEGEGKCGEGKCGEGKAAEAEGKCGEGKCGEEKKAEKKAEKTEGESKSGEHKCGEGKCGM